MSMTTARITRTCATLAAAAALALGLTGCGGPADQIDRDGRFTVGTDILAGGWRITAPEGTRGKPCTFVVINPDGSLVDTGPAGGAEGIPLADGQALNTLHCGTWTKVR